MFVFRPEIDTTSGVPDEPPPATPGDVFWSMLDANWKTWTVWSHDNGMEAAADRLNDQIFKATGQRLENPMRVLVEPTPGVEAPAMRDPSAVLIYDERRRVLAQQRPDLASLLRADVPLARLGADERRSANALADDIWERTPASTGKYLAAGSAMLGGMLQDPLTWTTGPLFTEIRAGAGAAGVAWAAMKSGAANAALVAGQQPFIQTWLQEAGLDYGVGVAIEHTAAAFLTGAAFDAGARGTWRAGRRALGHEQIVDDGVVVGYRRPADPKAAPLDALDAAATGAPEGSPIRRAADLEPDALREVAAKTGLDTEPAVRGALDVMALDHVARVPPAGVALEEHVGRFNDAVRAASDPAALPPGGALITGGGPEASPERIAEIFKKDPIALAAEIRDNPEILAEGLPWTDAQLRSAAHVSRLSEEAFDMVAGGEVHPAIGAIVAEHVADPDRHAGLLRRLAETDARTPAEIRQRLAGLLAGPRAAAAHARIAGVADELVDRPVSLVDDPHGPDAARQLEQLRRAHAAEIAAATGKAPEASNKAPEGDAGVLPKAAAAAAPVSSAEARVAAAIDSALRSGRLPKGVALKSFSDIAELPEGLRRPSARNNPAGLYDKGAIWIARDALDPDATLSHETIHALRQTGLLTDREMKLLAARADALPEVFDAARRAEYERAYAHMRPEDLAEAVAQEKVAHLYEARAHGANFGKQANGILRRIREVLERVKNALHGLGFQTADDVLTQIDDGTIARRRVEGLPLFSLRRDLAEREKAARAVMETPEWTRAASRDAITPEDDTALAPGFGGDEWQLTRRYVSAAGTPIVGFDGVVEHVIATAKASVPGGLKNERRAFILIGYPGAGKSTIAMAYRDHYGAARLTGDDAKPLIPEYRGGKNNGGVKVESDLIAEAAAVRLARSGSNLVLETAGREAGLRPRIKALKAAGYSVGLVHVDVPKAIAMERAVARFRRDGRPVPLNLYDTLRADEAYAKLRDEGVADATTRITPTDDEARWRVVDGRGDDHDAIRPDIDRIPPWPGAGRRSGNADVRGGDGGREERQAGLAAAGDDVLFALRRDAAAGSTSDDRIARLKAILQEELGERAEDGRGAPGGRNGQPGQGDAPGRPPATGADPGRADAAGSQRRPVGPTLYAAAYDALLRDRPDLTPYRNDFEGIGRDSLFVWRPEQVRSAFDTFDDRAAGGASLAESARHLEADIRQGLNAILKEEGLDDGGGPLFSLRDDARAQLKADLEEAAAIADATARASRERQALIDEGIRKKNEQFVTTLRDARGQVDPAKALIYLIESHGEVDLPAGMTSVVAEQKAVEAMAKAGMEELLHEFRPTAVTGQTRERARLTNVVRELAGEGTGDDAAKGLAQAWARTHERLRQEFNAAGGDIAKLEGWFLPQVHDRGALLKAGREQWVSDIVPALALERIVDGETRAPLSHAEIRAALADIWEHITSDGHGTLKANAENPFGGVTGDGAKKLANQRQEHRFLHFKSADAWLDYQKQYGGGADPFRAMMAHITAMSKDIAALRVLGTNPDRELARLARFVAKQAALMRPAAVIIDEARSKVKALTAQFVKSPTRLDEVVDRIGAIHKQIAAIREKHLGRVSKRNSKKIAALREDLIALNDERRRLLTRDLVRVEGLAPASPLDTLNAAFDELSAAEEGLDTVLFPKRSEILGKTMTRGGFWTTAPEDYAQSSISRASAMWDFYRGVTSAPVNAKAAAGMQSARNIGVISRGGAMVISSIADNFTQVMARRFTGLPAARTFADIVQQLGPNAKREAQRQALIGETYLHMFNDGARAAAGLHGAEWTTYLAERTIALQGLAALTDAQRRGFGMSLQAAVADLATKSWDEIGGLNPRLLKLFQRYGLSAGDWDAIRLDPATGVVRDVDFLSPNLVRDSLEAAGRGADRVAERYLGMILQETDFASPTAMLRARAAMLGKTRPGTLVGELLRTGLQFKSFAFMFGMLHFERALREAVASGAIKGASYAAQALTVMTLGGALVVQLKDLKGGKDPRPMDRPGFWYAALLQGGGLGIMGDLLNAESNRFGGGVASTFSGPVAGMVDESFGALGLKGNMTARQGALRMATGYVPGSSLWYVNLAWQRIAAESLQRQIDPHAYDAFRRRQQNQLRDYGNGFWWAPGDTAPARGPRLN